MDESIEKMIYSETESRLKEMEKPDYVFPKKADFIDAIGIIAFVTISIVLVVLCMVGGIQ